VFEQWSAECHLVKLWFMHFNN